jgi:hypothetical protein
VVHSKNAEVDRSFFRDILGFKSVDAGHGWLIFAMPPTEASFHPSDEDDVHEFYFMCDDLKTERLRSQRRVLSALRLRRHDGVPLQRCGFPVVATSVFISQSTQRP